METVEVVIRIPKSKLDRINKIANGIWGTSGLNAQEIAILNGTVLQKGHGRLVDENEVEDLRCKYFDFSDNEVGCIKRGVSRLKTIVEADKEV